MDWIYLAFLTAFLYGAYNFFIKLSSSHINQIAGAVILQLVATLAGGAILLFLKITGRPIAISGKGTLYAVFAGLCIGLAEIASFFLFSKGVIVSVGTPLIIGGSVVFASILGIAFLKEQLSLVHFLAILLVMGGAVLLVKFP